MGRKGQVLNSLGRLMKLDRGNILVRCEEILQAVYGITRVPKPTFFSNSKRIATIGRIIGRLRLNSISCTNSAGRYRGGVQVDGLSPTFAFNLARHARRCCTAIRPKCTTCPLVSFCSSGIKRTASSSDGKPIAIDVFAGAGGLSAGFRREGYKNAAQSYRVNNPGVPVIEADVRKIQPNEILKVLGLRQGHITAVIAGPPCQGFSAAGPRKPRARRNFLFHHVGRVAKGFAANLLVMENVPGLKRVNGVGFENRILKYFSRSGYVGKAIEVDASTFGVPQRRKRLIFLCARRPFDIASFQLSPLKFSVKATVTLALRKLPRAYTRRSEDRYHVRRKYNHQAMVHSTKVVTKIKRIKPGEGPISYRRLRLDVAGQCRSIPANIELSR